jgi:hypothetical protein
MMKYLLIFSVVVLSCSKGKGPGKDPAIGMPGKINIVVNPSIWKGAISKTFDSLFSAEMTVLPRPESVFKYRQVNPDEVNASMKRTRNLIFIMALDDNSEAGLKLKGMVTQATLDAVAADTAIFMSSLPDVYATNQEVLYLFGANKAVLMEKVLRNGAKIVEHFNRRERQRLEKGLLNASTTKGLTEQLAKEHGFTIKIPYGYRLADNQKDFVWLRQINSMDDKDVFIAWKEYKSPSDFKKENLIRFRDDV